MMDRETTKAIIAELEKLLFEEAEAFLQSHNIDGDLEMRKMT